MFRVSIKCNFVLNVTTFPCPWRKYVCIHVANHIITERNTFAFINVDILLRDISWYISKKKTLYYVYPIFEQSNHVVKTYLPKRIKINDSLRLLQLRILESDEFGMCYENKVDDPNFYLYICIYDILMQCSSVVDEPMIKNTEV